MMLGSELIKWVQQIIDTKGDLEVDISVEKQPETTDQQYLVAAARFVIPEEYKEGTRIMIRDWPY